MSSTAPIIAAAEAAGICYDETHDGVQIGNLTVEAHIDGYRVIRWIGYGPDTRTVDEGVYADADAAIAAAKAGEA